MPRSSQSRRREARDRSNGTLQAAATVWAAALELPDGFTHPTPGELTEDELAAQVTRAEACAAELDRMLHAGREPVPRAGHTCLLVDDVLHLRHA